MNKSRTESTSRFMRKDMRRSMRQRIFQTLVASSLCIFSIFAISAVLESSAAQKADQAKLWSSSYEELQSLLPSNTKTQTFVSALNQQTASVNGEKTIFSHTWLDGQEGRFSHFVRVNILKESENSHDVVFKSLANTQAINKGDWVYVSYYVRAVPNAENSTANVRGFIERGTPSWMMVSDASVAATETWTRVVALGRAPERLAPESTYLSLHLSTQKQSLDIADLVYVALPSNLNVEAFPVTEFNYAGMEAEASWRETAAEMIQQYRHDSFTIFVLDEQGKAVNAQDISIDMQDIDYELGSMAHALIVEDSDLGEQYRLWFDQFFNYATATIYWADWGWENPEVREQYINKMAYFKEQNIPARGHTLLYPAFRFSPQVLIDLQDDKDAFIARVNQQIDEMVPLLKKYGINEYDVINELRAEKEWLDIVGIDTVVEWYKRVHALHPEAVLYLNENSILTDGGNNVSQQDHYFNLLTELLAKGAPIHGIGMQGHFNGIATPIEKMWAILDRFSVFNLPIRITEYDTDTKDTTGQAKFDTDFYEAMYAHPATVGVTRWGFYEPRMWRPNGALIDDSNRFKPNAHAYLDWLDQKRSLSLNIKTDEHGIVKFKGAYGTYKVTVGEESFQCAFSQVRIDAGKAKTSEVPSCTVRLQ